LVDITIDLSKALGRSSYDSATGAAFQPRLAPGGAMLRSNEFQSAAVLVSPLLRAGLIYQNGKKPS